MHNSEIFYKVKCNETKNKRSDKNLGGAWTVSDDQFGHMLVPTIYLILLYSKLRGKLFFIIKNTFLYDLTKTSGP